jgi:hypothetical protein
MQTPVEIDFQGVSGTREIHASMEQHVAELEGRDRITACRLCSKAPGGASSDRRSDAFKRPRRRLLDHVRRLQGQVNQHESQPIGIKIVKNFNALMQFWNLDVSSEGRRYWAVCPDPR